MTFFWVAVVMFMGSLLQGSSGFGFGILSMSLITLLFSVKDSMLMLTAVAAVLTFRIFLRYRRFIDWKTVGWLLIFTFTGRLVAFEFVNRYGEAAFLKQWLGFFLIGMVLYLLLKDRFSWYFRGDKPLLVGATAGMLSGFVSGVFAVGGPFLVLYFMMRSEPKKAYQANLQAIFFTSNVFTLSLHGANGDLNHLFGYIAVGILTVLVGVKQGLKWYERVSQKTVQRIASLVVLIAAVQLIV